MESWLVDSGVDREMGHLDASSSGPVGNGLSQLARREVGGPDTVTLNSKLRDSPGRVPLGRDANTIQHQRGKFDAAASRMDRIGRRRIDIFPMARSRGVDEVNDRRRGSHEQENGGRSMYVGIN